LGGRISAVAHPPRGGAVQEGVLPTSKYYLICYVINRQSNASVCIFIIEIKTGIRIKEEEIKVD